MSNGDPKANGEKFYRATTIGLLTMVIAGGGWMSNRALNQLEAVAQQSARSAQTIEAIQKSSEKRDALLETIARKLP